MASDQNKEDPANNEEPEEARQEDRQQEKVLVDEHTLLVSLHFHIHHDGHGHEGN